MEQLQNNIEIIRKSNAWKRICSSVERGIRPNSVIIRVGEQLSLASALLVAELLLRNMDPCKIMSEEEILNTEGDPDLILSGDIKIPPGVDRCREITNELAMKPIASNGRIAVIFSADRLSLSAANSLLKVAEEPPQGASVLFISSPDTEMIPTLNSRSWIFSILSERENVCEPVPGNETEWLDWLSENGKRNIEDIIEDLEKWINYSLSEKNFLLAGHLEELKIIGATKRLSKIMFQDLILLVIKEGTPFERILGDFW